MKFAHKYEVKSGLVHRNGKPATLAELLPERPNDQGKVNGKLVYFTGDQPLTYWKDNQARLPDGVYVRVDCPDWRPGQKKVAAYFFHESVSHRAEQMRLALNKS